MSKPILEVSGVSKVFRNYRSELQRIATWFGIDQQPSEEFVVLQNISFTLQAGQALGIVGQNGAGKSTLLKIITGTLTPSKGQVMVQGRISALLELGLGFHPEFTARQNVYHSGGLMGLSQARIEALMPEIEAFAEIGSYFDEPIRTFSSGMQMRVAFSLATAIEPDILIIDEALSVGDTYFQHKCFERIRKFRKQGTSLLLVSHDPIAVQSLCDRAVLLDQGALIKDGPPLEIMDFYNALIADRGNSAVQQNKKQNGGTETRSGSRDAVIERVLLLNAAKEPVEYVNVGETVTLEIRAFAQKPIKELTAGYLIRDRLGRPVYGTNTFHLGKSIAGVPENDRVSFRFCFSANMGEGSYSVSVALHESYSHVDNNYDWWDLAVVFNMVNAGCEQFAGVAWLPPQVEIRRQAEL